MSCLTKVLRRALKKPPFPIPRREVVYVQDPHRANLLDEERGTGRRRPVASPVDCDEGDRVIASLGHVYDGSIAGGGVVQNGVRLSREKGFAPWRFYEACGEGPNEQPLFAPHPLAVPPLRREYASRHTRQ
jgi:hypothetical protein